ncbi:MAG: Gx transporter family protein [Oscillospiraceae bacterium]|jgi:heptaprenyl diphosphate synthase|nr:Gx transporter family protein [Oscillospiraceae bacterium]
MTKKLTLMSILTAIALIIFIIESLIPIPIPIPGIKLGLANAVTLFALFLVRQNNQAEQKNQTEQTLPLKQTKITQIYYLSTLNVFAILLCRILLGALFTGRMTAFILSLSGGILAFLAQVLLKRLVTNKQIWALGAVGAVFHNIGQILAAIIITGTPAIVTYLPILIIAGIITGSITGLVAQMTLHRITQNYKK